MNDRKLPTAKAPERSEGRLVVRGCWELIIKLIIILVVIAAFVTYWRSQREVELPAWIFVLLLLALLIWLLIKQGHFVILKCQLIEPAGCKHGDPTILTDHVLEPVTGTAAGIGFTHYELEVLWNGTMAISDAIIYADLAGNPDTAATVGAHQVSGGVLGFVDLQKAALGAGMNIHTSTTFEVRLHVYGFGGHHKMCTTTFSIVAARAYIKTIGGALADDITDVNEDLERVDDGTLATVGGSISVRGAADAYGCGSQEIAEYSLWIKADPTFGISQPANGSPYDPVTNGWTNITTVTYTSASQRAFNTLDGMPDPDFLTNRSTWGTRTVCSWVDWLPPICFSVPDLKEFWWNSDPSGAATGSGKYTFLLKVEDTVGNLYYDIQRAWIDNEIIRGKIEQLAGVGLCEDIHILDVPGGIIAVEGYATDPLIVPGDTTTPTSDNFKEYKVKFQKQGAPTWVELDIPLAGGSHPGLAETNPVPDRATWSGGPSDPPTGVIAEWDLRWLDAAANPKSLPANQLLVAEESCTYNLMLQVWDKTIFSESYSFQHYPHYTWKVFPVKIHNGHEPSP